MYFSINFTLDIIISECAWKHWKYSIGWPLDADYLMLHYKEEGLYQISCKFFSNEKNTFSQSFDLVQHGSLLALIVVLICHNIISISFFRVTTFISV